MQSLRKEFQNPALSFRGAPFWSWNDNLMVPELVRQVHDMKEHGMGGFFMHSREGLETPYMGEKWMECIQETVKAASQTGMNAWLYDEDRWPSGFAGGLVPAQGGDAFRSKLLQLEICEQLPEDLSSVLVIFVGVIKDGKLLSVRRLSPSDQVRRQDEVYLLFHRKISGASEWFNNDSYADNLNPDSVAAFIDITYEAYKKAVGNEFGKAVPGIFTDEPNIISHHSKLGDRVLPWTDGLPQMFQERRGYDLLDVLPWLFFQGEKSARTRHDFWYTISQRFTEAYSMQIGEWCEQNGFAFTGHFLYEQEMGNGILTGGAIMPHYRYQQVPGIDMLTEQNREFLTIKQCSSVANQFGKQRVLSETYGCSGWEFTFEGQKWNGDWQYVLGVNLRCQHLALYSLRGCRKRDYPPSFNYNTTWWKYNKVVEDYFARVGLLMSQGFAVRDVLLLHPVSTGWSMLGEGAASKEEVNEYANRLNDFVRALLATHYDFDFGDEQILSKDANIVAGKVKVGQMRYGVVIIPPEMRTMLPSTVDLLERFLVEGGKIVAFTPLPDWIAAQPDERLNQLWLHPGVIKLSSVAFLNQTLEALLPRRVSLLTRHGQQAAHLLYMQRQFDGKYAYFIVNNDREHGYHLHVELEGQGSLEEWNALTGEMKKLGVKPKDGKFNFDTFIGPAGSVLYIVNPEAQPDGISIVTLHDLEKNYSRPIQPVSYIGPKCRFTRTDPNVLTLDRCCYRLGGDSWSDEMEVWRAQSAIRKVLGMRPNYYNGLPQRYRWALTPHERDGEPVELKFNFSVNSIPDAPVFLLVEGAHQFAIQFNGQSVNNKPTGWYLDRSFEKVKLPSLQKGKNEIVLHCEYTNYMEMEDCFILGDFGVSLDREIIAEPTYLYMGDWTSQGYPHYAGSMIYHGQYNYQGNKQVFVKFGEYQAVDIAIHINEKLVGHIPWVSENNLEITRFLVPGINQLDFEVVGSPRNMLGPLHRAPEHEMWTDWRSFRRTDSSYTPDYVLWHWGLKGQIRLIEL